MKQLFSRVLQMQSTVKEQTQGIFQAVLQVSIGACIIACASQIALTLPFSCVPFTLQPQAVMALAVLFGPTRALQSVVLFLCMGASGAPVFAQGCGSFLHLAGPRGGYLLSYLLVAPLVGRLAQVSQGLWSLLGVLMLGNALIFSCGCLWLSMWIGMPQAFATGVLPFLVSCFAKDILLATSITMGSSLFRRK